jgi:hypothetical protein
MYELGFFIVEAALLLIPPAALISIRLLQNRVTILQLASVIVGIVTTTIMAVYFHIGFIFPLVSILWFFVGYFTYCFFAAFCFRIKRKALRFLSLVILAVPIVLGYALATVGRLGLMFILADVLAKPSYSQVTADGLNCKVTGWGGAWGDSGFRGGLYRTWSFVPLIQKEITWIDVDQSNDQVSRSSGASQSAPINEEELCAQLAKEYSATQ